MDLTPEAVRRIVDSLDPSLKAGRFVRLGGGSTEVYKLDIAGAHANPLVLKIYADEPGWAPAKESLVAGWLSALTACSALAASG